VVHQEAEESQQDCSQSADVIVFAYDFSSSLVLSKWRGGLVPLALVFLYVSLSLIGDIGIGNKKDYSIGVLYPHEQIVNLTFQLFTSLDVKLFNKSFCLMHEEMNSFKIGHS